VSRLVALLALAVAFPGRAGAAEPAGAGRVWTLEECVAEARSRSGQVSEARAKLGEWEAKLAEVRAVFFPKLTGLAFGAPMFGVKGSALSPDVERDYGRWGPYLHAEALLVQPLYTFGRAEEGIEAARERVEVERAELELSRQRVSLEVRRLYYLHLYARGFQPTLRTIRKLLDEAQAKAAELYAATSGKVTNVDLMKLKYASTELDKAAVQAETGAAIALAALQHTMGLPAVPAIALAEEALPEVQEGALQPLDDLVQLARERRPEIAQLRHGKKATLHLERSEASADLPALGLVGQLSASWTPSRTDARNPYHYDPYNDVTGGIALALQFDVNPARSRARSAGARSLGEQVDGLAHLAATGIPLEVLKARAEAEQARSLVRSSTEGVSAARKWMVFAGAAYAAGTGDTRDLLEGLAAYGAARKGYFDALLAWHLAVAQLGHVGGGEVSLGPGRAPGGPAAGPRPAAQTP